MILGGGPNQFPFIKKAKENGLYIILCDMDDENMSMDYIDKFYKVSIMDKKEILSIGRSENIDGIFTSSEPGMYAASYVSENMNLPGISYENFSILVNKFKMKEFLKNNGFNYPKHIIIDKDYDLNKILEEIKSWNSKVIIKPTEASGSRGVNILDDEDNLDKLIKEALSFSRVNQAICEEYIEQKYDFMLGGDIYIQDREVVFWGLMDSMRDLNINDIVPTGTRFPSSLNDKEINEIKVTINRVINLLEISNATFNIEIMFDKKGKLYINELNPRSGGNLIPEVLNIATGFDFYKIAPLGACNSIKFDGEYDYEKRFISTYVIHSEKDGILKDIIIEDSLKENIIDEIKYKELGDKVEVFSNASKKIEILILEFENFDEMMYKLRNIKDFINVIVE